MMLNLEKSTWQRVKFGDVVTNANVKSADPETDGIDRVIAMEHLDPGELAINRWGSLDSGTTFTRRVSAGQTLFGKRRAYQRKVAYAEFDAICSGDILTFEAIPGKLLPELLPFIVQSDPFFERAVGTSAGSLSPRTNWRDLAKFEFDLPPLDEQKRISDLLWAFEQCTRSAAELADLLQENLSTWVNREIASSGWNEIPVENLLVSGPTNGLSARANDQKIGLPTLSINAVRSGILSPKNAVKYVDVDPRKAAKYTIKDGDVFVVRGNGNRSLVAQSGIAAGNLPAGCIFPDLLIRLRFDRDKIIPDFAVTQWNSTPAHNSLVKKAKSTNGTWKVNGKDIRSHTLRVPSIDTQEEFLKEVSRFKNALTSLEGEATTLAEARTSLLSSVFGAL